MNKLKIIILAIITLGVIASPAVAADRLSNSNFFYGETIADPIEAVNTAAVHQPENVQSRAAVLSAADFFYGETVPNHVETVKTTGYQHNTPAVAAVKNQLTPEVFYGYTDANGIDVQCNC